MSITISDITSTAYDPTILHRDYVDMYVKWQKIKDCIEGEEAVKEKREIYLPYPVPVTEEDKATEEYKTQYDTYLNGAHFVEFTAEAVEDLVAAAFRRPLNIDPALPEQLDYLDLEDIAKELTYTAGAYGRVFFFIDYPTVETSPTMEMDRENRAYISIYEPLDVLNWVEDRRSGHPKLVEVVIREIDPLMTTEATAVYMYRRLYIEDNVFKIDIYKENQYIRTLTPVANGKPFNEIPGMFIGTTSNTAKVDKPPVIGIANSNLKHYQTWADLMHVQVYSGNPQLVLTGLPPGWNKSKARQDVKLKLDAATVLAVEGEGSKAQLMQVNTDNLVHFRTLEMLKMDMLEQGMKLKAISNKAGVESASALKIRSSASMSKLASIVHNVENGLNKSLEWLATYMAIPKPETIIVVNKEFFQPDPDGALLTSISSAEASCTAPKGTTINYLKQIELLNDKVPNETYLKDMECPQEVVEANKSNGVRQTATQSEGD